MNGLIQGLNALIQFISDPTNDFTGHSIAYFQICGVSIVIAIIIGVVLGVAVAWNSALTFIAVNLSGLMRAIPIIAFLIAVIPYLGIGFKPTVVALIVLGIPPILLNTATGMRGIDPATIDAAKGMGFTNWQILARIQMPLVLPLIAAGVRTAAIQIIATATLASIIGAGGYGDYIIDGLSRLDNTALLAGALPVSLLAIIVEVFMSGLQRLLTPAGLRVQEQVEVARA